MGKEIRKTGIDIIGDVRWGTHFCQFYQTKEDLIDVLVPYFKAGLENNEFCMWVTSEPLNEKEAEEAMIRVIPDFTQYLKSGQIEIIPYTEWYTKSGKFDADEVLQGWVKKEKQALKRGFDGLRLTGNTFWLERKDWKDFSDYEEEVNSVIGEYRMLAICTYSLDRCGASEVIDVVSNHQFALIRREGKWELIESSEHKQAEEALREAGERHRAIFEQAVESIVLVDAETGALVDFNDSAHENLGYTREEFEKLTIPDFEVIESAEEVAKHIEKVIKNGSDVFETQHRTKNGEIRDIEVSSKPLHIGGRKYAQSVWRDITERKQAEEALRESEAGLAKAQQIAHLGNFDWNVKDNTSYLSDEYYRIFVLSPREVGFAYEEFISHVHPDDREFVKRATEESFYQNAPHSIDYRIILPDGSERTVHSDAEVTFDEAGEPIRMVGIIQDITERKQAEEALRTEEQNFRHSLDNSPLGIRIIDINAWGETIYANRAILDIYGYSSIEEFKSLPAVERHTPRSYAERQERVRKREAGEPVPGYFEQSIIRKDGEVRDLEVFNREVLWGGEKQFQLIYHDVTDRKWVEDALHKSEKQASAAIEAARALTFNYDIATGKIEWGGAIEEITGYTREEFAKIDVDGWADRIHPDDRDRILSILQEAMGKDRAMAEYRFKTKKGYVTLSSISLTEKQDGKAIRLVGILQDITERKRAEEREKEMQKELNLASRLASVGELAAGVAHEINNPLTGVLAFSERLLRKSTDEKVSRDLKRINNEARRAARVVERLLTFARRREPEKEYLNINSVVRKALELRAYELKTGNIEVQLDLAPGLPRVMVDFHQFQEVFLNIIMNAEQAITEADRGGKLGIKTREMKGCIRISFTDDGPGISPEYLDRVFDPFFTTREEEGGTGLGLSICHGIVHRHDGRIYAKSKQGKGTTLIVDLPMTGEKVKEAKRS